MTTCAFRNEADCTEDLEGAPGFLPGWRPPRQPSPAPGTRPRCLGCSRVVHPAEPSLPHAPLLAFAGRDTGAILVLTMILCF